jgi:hypothetical protein
MSGPISDISAFGIFGKCRAVTIGCNFRRRQAPKTENGASFAHKTPRMKGGDTLNDT